MALWAVHPAVLGQLADPLPDRMKLFLRRIAPDDFATEPPPHAPSPEVA
jgi:hypothetical protein